MNFSGRNNMKNTKTNKILLTALLVVFLITPFSSYAVPSLDQQINQIDIKLRNEKAALNDAKDEVFDAKTQVNQINQQLAATQANINSLSKEISNKENEIKITEEKILKNKETLKELVRLLYEKGQPGTLEMLASTQSLTDLMNTEEYNRALEERINTTVAENRALKAGLINQKQQLSEKKARLEVERQAQLAQQEAKKALLNEKYQQQLAIEKQVKISEQEKKNLLAQRAAESRRVSSGGSGGYPYTAIWAVDPWGFYTRECTSYAAWKWNRVYGKTWYNTQPRRGSAKYWPEIARTLKYSVNYSPRVGDIMVWSGGTWGHVAIVEAVYDNGTVLVSHYNYGFDNRYSTDIVSWAGKQFIR